MELERPSAADFANRSACSLPATLLWLEIHLMVSVQVVLLEANRRACSRCCPADVLGDLSVRITAWLSINSVTFFAVVSGVFVRIQRARMAPTISASYVLCCSLVPMNFCNILRGRGLFFGVVLLRLQLLHFDRSHQKIV